MAKKLAILILLVALAAPLVTFAQAIAGCTLGRNITYGGITYTKGIRVENPEESTLPACTPPAAAADCKSDDWGTICLLNSIYNVTDWISFILLAVAAIMIIMGAFTLATAAGAPEKVTAGRNYIIFACVGLVVALLSRAIPAIARRFVGG
jgi:hypothetical protein